MVLVGLADVMQAASGRQETVPLNPPHLRSVRFVDDTHGWIAGYNGVFLTNDGGNSWRRLNVSLGSISKFAFTVATDLGLVAWADRDGAIFRNDRGLTEVTYRPLRWKDVPISADPLVYMSTIKFADRKNGFASGISHEVFRTTDGGLTWRAFNTPADDILKGLFVASPSEVWVVGVEGIVLHTTDLGRNWEHTILKESNDDPAKGLSSVFFIDGKTGWVCGPSKAIFHTKDGGRNWLRQNPSLVEDLPSSLNAMSFANDSEGWVVGQYTTDYVKQQFQGIILHTTDGGRHWDQQGINLTQRLLDVQALPNGRAWVVGESGAVIRTLNHGMHWESMQFDRGIERIVFAASK